MTRTTNDGLYGDTSQGFKVRDLQKRVEIINQNKPDLALSIHLNVYQKSYRRGAQVFYPKNSESSLALAKNIQTHLNLLSESKKMYDALCGDYYILNNSNSPAVIVECGFLSNGEEEILLQSPEYQSKIALAISNGILQYLSC
jgi:N-acetylmuramoyl-L-alanine amidase